MSPAFMPPDRSRLDVLAEFLSRPAELETRYSEVDFGWKGAAGSQAEREGSYTGPRPAEMEWNPRVTMTTRASIRLLLTCMAEQCLAVGRLITDETLGAHGILGPEACARSAVE